MFNPRSARALKPGEHLIVEQAPGLRLAATASGHSWIYRYRLRLIARGLGNKHIARELTLSPHTAKRHVAHILEKLDVASRSQAAGWYHARVAA